MSENMEINKAKEELEKISSDEHERYLAELREKYIMDQKAIESAGYYKGIKEGKTEGINIGENKKKTEIKNEITTLIQKGKLPQDTLNQIHSLKM